jgi:nicotinamidase-related amidase
MDGQKTTPQNATALLVVDVQASFPARPYWRDDDAAEFLVAQNRLIADWLTQKMPIVRIFHVEPTGAFSKASGLVRPLEGLADFEAALLVEKTAHSAFVRTPLEDWLRASGIKRIAVSGIRTEQCCETTTRHGSDLGFEVDYVTAATLSFPMQHASGRTYSVEEIRERTELVLADRFATIVTVEGASARASAFAKKAA